MGTEIISMDTPRIHTFETREEAAASLADSLVKEYLHSDTKHPLLLLFSGGSALSIIEHLPIPADVSLLTFSVVDERDDPSLNTSNFQELKHTEWFQKMTAGGASYIDPLADARLSSEEKAAAFEHALRQWKKGHEDGSIVALLGMGADGHTAGVFPARNTKTFDRLFRGDRWVVAHTVPDAPSYPERITTTLTFLQKEVHKVYVFICGLEKEAAWKHLLAQDMPLPMLPLLGIYGMHQGEIFTDLKSKAFSQEN